MRTLQIYVEASPASEECSADQSLASSPVVNVLITLSLMGKKDTSALKVVCGFFFYLSTHYHLLKTTMTDLIISPCTFLFPDMCIPPFPFPCHKYAYCNSTKQSYTCTCMEGFNGDGHNCTGSEHSALEHE